MRQSGSNVQMMHSRRLLEAIDNGEIAIPDFQRDFDWSETDVRELLITVFAGWPAGSLLLLDAHRELFQLRPLEGGPKITQPMYSILDGQQRLTSLYHAFYDKGDVIYAIDWSGGLVPDLDEQVVSFPRKSWIKHRLNLIPEQAKEKLLPVTVLKTASSFFEWRDQIVDQYRQDRRQDARREITEFYTKKLSAAHEYEFPSVILESSLEPEAIARIFERVNRTGLKLNAFDLMVAKTFRPDWNLREKWIDLRRRHAAISAFLGEDGMPLLQAIALRDRADVRKSSVLSLSAALVRDEWSAAGEASKNAVTFLKEDCSVLREQFVPYQSLIALLTALDMGGQLAVRREYLTRWFWQVTFSRAFDVASNTRIVTHYRNLIADKEQFAWEMSI